MVYYTVFRKQLLFEMNNGRLEEGMTVAELLVGGINFLNVHFLTFKVVLIFTSFIGYCEVQRR